jgi:hypothetical protein
MTNRPPTWMLVLGGALSLAVAMGIGRFAFTPVLPLMLRAGQLDVAAGGWIAAANYAGYLVGALTAARLPLRAGTLALVALAATALLTAGMALPGIAWWIALRFAAGVASAWVFVATSLWCLGGLAQRDAAGQGGWVYAGVGCGIAFAGLYCIAASGFSPAAVWLQLGALAALFSLPVLAVLRRLDTANAPTPAAAVAALPMDRETRGLILCYGAMGFGYILPATFLPVLARSVVDDPRLFGLAWPVFGATAALSTVLAAVLARHATRLQVWAASQLLMAAGVLLPSLWLHGVTIALSALLVGGTFMVITLLGVQELRARAPAQAAHAVGRLTAAFALGQIAGPVASALLLQWPALGAHGLDVALQLGAASLLASGLWLARRAFFSTPDPETQHA